MPPQSIPTLLEQQAQQRPKAPAILGLADDPLTYGGLYDFLKTTVESLHIFGIGRNQRVALIMPQGPELATALLSLSSCATAVPLSPALTATEYRSYLQATKLEWLVIQSDLTSEARSVAVECGIPIIELTVSKGSTSGLFSLTGKRSSQTPPTEWAGPEDIAILFLSSGTTSQPKIIPRSQCEIVEGETTRVEFLGYSSQDRVLNVLPLWFAGGHAEFMQMMFVGGSIVCTPGFDASRFFEWLDRFQPTAFMATASVYRVILPFIPANQHILSRHTLRHLKTGGMVTPAELLDALEKAFGVPVLHLYAATEVYSITLSPVPPKVRKRDSVGVVYEGEVHIFDENDRSLPPGEVGEIRVRGPYVFKGYEGDPGATKNAFVNGWYCTGDLGYFDEDGYLFITGRIKEVISRGGEKISPQELEATLKTCPGVVEVAVFGVPDPHVGQEVGAAIVVRPGVSLSEGDIRTFASAHLAASKIPRHVVFLDTLPKTPLGKIKRLALADLITLPKLDKTYTAPRTDVERKLVELWADLLHRSAGSISVTTHFRDSGGDSLASARLVFKVREAFKVLVTIVDFFATPTIAQQAEVIEKLLLDPNVQRKASTLVPIRAEGTRYPLYCLHALDGGVYFYESLVPLLNSDQPIYGLQGIGMDGTEAPLDRIEDMAARHAQEIRSVQLRGPYFLLGYSAGGRLALETARFLRDTYGEAAYVFMADDHIGVNLMEQTRQQKMAGAAWLTRLWLRLDSLIYVLFRLPLRYKVRYFAEKLPASRRRKAQHEERMAFERELVQQEQFMPPAVLEVKRSIQRAVKAYTIRPYDGPLTYLRASDDYVYLPFFQAWEKINLGQGEIIEALGTHWTIMKPPLIENTVSQLQRWLDKSMERAKG